MGKPRGVFAIETLTPALAPRARAIQPPTGTRRLPTGSTPIGALNVPIAFVSLGGLAVAAHSGGRGAGRGALIGEGAW